MREKFKPIWLIHPAQNDDLTANHRIIEINGEKYYVKDDIAALTHAVLLLVDEIYDK